MGHPKESSRTGIGMRKNPNAPRKPIRKPGELFDAGLSLILKRQGIKLRKPIRKVSKKQAARTAALKEKLKWLLTAQKLVYGHERCEWMAAWKQGRTNEPHDKCGGGLVADHVNLRAKSHKVPNPDGFINLQALCWRANRLKGSLRIDFRPPEMKAMLEKMDRESLA